MQGAQKLRSEAYLRVRRNDEGEVQRSGWIFYETIKNIFNRDVTLKPMVPFENLKGKAFFFLLFIWFLWFLSFTTRAIFSTVLPLIEDEFAVNHATASSIFVFMSFGYTLSLLASGLLGGRVGYKKFICFCLVGSAFIFLAIPFVNTFPPLRIFSFFLGLFAGIYLPSSIPLLTAYYRERDWGKTIAIHDSAASFSIFASPFICLGIMTFLSWRGIFAIIGALALLCGIIFYFLGPEVKIRREIGRAHV
jgi:MFS family permease